MPETLAAGVKAMVKGATLLGTMELRTSVLGKSEAKQEEERMERCLRATSADLPPPQPAALPARARARRLSAAAGTRAR